MIPRRGAVAFGPSGVVYLLLNPMTIKWRKSDLTETDELCWECLKLCPSSNNPGFEGREGEVCQIREQWLLRDAEEF